MPAVSENHFANADLPAAIDHHLAGRFAEAEQIYLALLRQNRDNADALCLYGVLIQQAGQFELALEFMRKALSLQPENYMYLTNLAGALKDQSAFEESLQLYQRALALQEGDAVTLFNTASVLQNLRRFAEAIPYYQKMIAMQPEMAEAWNDMGVAQMALNRFEDAAGSFSKAIEIRPAYAEALNNLGVAMKNMKLYDAAMLWYQRAIEANPSYAKALFNLGTIHFIRKDFNLAMRLYQQSLALEPGQVGAHQNIASMLLDMGKIEEAQQHRDIAYRQQAIFIDTAAKPVKTVLVLWAAGKGNVPIDFLFPKDCYTRIIWMMEYATEQQRQSLPEYDFVFNAIGDPDVTGPTAANVAAFLAQCERTVLNAPAQIEKTSRDQIADLLGRIENVICPATLCLPTPEFKQGVLASSLAFPIIVRPAGSHGGDHLLKLETPQALKSLAMFPAEVYYASEYVDYCSADGYFRKYRIAFIDRQPYPYHLAIGKNWIIHYETADMLSAPWKLEEEKRYLENPRQAIGEHAMRAIEQIGLAMDLDFCGVDFSILPDGKVLVFEANATMLIHPEDEGSVLQHKNAYVQKIFEAFNRRIMPLHA